MLAIFENPQKCVGCCDQGTANLAEVSNCITRLRIVVSDSAKVDQQALKSIPGVKGVISKDKAVQVVIGLQAEHIANEIKEEIKR